MTDAKAAWLAGYHDCQCRDCFEIAIGTPMCSSCEKAGCEGGDAKCEAPGAYGSCTDTGDEE